MKRASLLLLIAASALSAFRTDFSLARRDPNKNPDLYLHFDLVSIGGGVARWDLHHERPFEATVIATAPYVGLEFHHVRAGFGLFDGGYFSTFSFLPLSIGYTIYEKPIHRWGRLYSREPEVYVQATARFESGYDPPPYIPFVGTLEAVCAGNYIGVGLSAVAGVAYAVDEGYAPYWPRKRYVYPFFALQVHFPDLIIGF
jgi:hypothetical protein